MWKPLAKPIWPNVDDNPALWGGCLYQKLIVTTSQNPLPDLERKARAWAARLAMPYVPRTASLLRLVEEHEVQGVLVITTQRPVYHEPARGLTYFYHPNMLKVRLHNCLRGHLDPLLQAMELQPGARVLDCTLGRGTDAALAAWKVGPTGCVVGLEKSLLLGELTREGLATYEDPRPEITALLRRIIVYCADYSLFLPACADKSFDVVYFDPLFDVPLAESEAMAPLRALGDPSPLKAEAVREACRVASRRVVIKQRQGTSLWEHLFISQIIKGEHSRIEYGVIETG